MWKCIATLVVTSLLLLTGCREADQPFGPGADGAVFVDSDPRGAVILVNGEAVEGGAVTPDTVRGLRAGVDTLISAVLDTLGVVYGFSVSVPTVYADSVLSVRGPLLLRCGTGECYDRHTREYGPPGMRFAASPVGTLFLEDGWGDGLYWPGTTDNSYVSGGSAVFAAAVEGAADTVSLGPYDRTYLAGRPVAEAVDEDTRFALRQTAWVLPVPRTLLRPTVRGIEVRQEVTGRSEVDDVIAVRLVFRNITDRASYQAVDPAVPASGVTYTAAYIGFALDADVGNGEVEANDDLLSYVPEDRLVFMYDSDFRADGFQGGWGDRPGLVGLRVLAAPEGTEVVLNGWPGALGGQAVDWQAGEVSEPFGWHWLSATQTVLPPFGDALAGGPRLGYVPTGPDDYRMSVSAGPLTLAPGDSAVLTVAVVLAEPAEGTYTSGSVLEPGEPTDAGRPLLDAAAVLRQKAAGADALLEADVP